MLKDTPGSAPFFSPFRAAVITAEGDTVKVVLPPEIFDEIRTTAMYVHLFAPEVPEKGYNMADWRNNHGTGPFVLKEFVPASSATMARNDNYWQTDPCGPGEGNQLPYVDSLKMLVITDLSTRLAALRSGKIDVLHNVEWENLDSLISANPELSYVEMYSDAMHAIGMRTDKAELPFSKKEVRQAIMMATDFDTIRDTWGGGKAQINTWPVHYTPEDAPAYMDLEDPDCPEAVRELYVYSPDKARQMLSNAGYPDGFKTTMVVRNTPSWVDYVSILVDQWSKVGITVELETLEQGAFTSVRNNRDYKEMIHQASMINANLMIGSGFDGQTRAGNMSYVNDPVVKAAIAEWNPYTITDPLKAMEIHRNLMPYVLEQAWTIPGVNPPQYHLWWPWLKNFHGENAMGRTQRGYTKYVWLDQSMKESMGY
jgi:ABC-type transport system substrate-binding protein